MSLVISAYLNLYITKPFRSKSRASDWPLHPIVETFIMSMMLYRHTRILITKPESRNSATRRVTALASLNNPIAILYSTLINITITIIPSSRNQTSLKDIAYLSINQSIASKKSEQIN